MLCQSLFLLLRAREIECLAAALNKVQESPSTHLLRDSQGLPMLNEPPEADHTPEDLHMLTGNPVIATEPGG
jgi:hypothetical protein